MQWFLSAALASLTALLGAETPVPNRPPAPVKRDGHVLLSATDRHVRAVNDTLQQLVARGMARSATFSKLMTALDNTNVIVYVEFNSRLSAAVAGRLLFAVSTENVRYLRVQISPEGTNNQLVAVIAHELQHALEVGQSPDVRDEASFADLYKRIGQELSAATNINFGNRVARCFDTIEARAMGRRVMLELEG
jgi:hypothetical protein